jgi:hypothetical protein
MLSPKYGGVRYRQNWSVVSRQLAVAGVAELTLTLQNGVGRSLEGGPG